MEKECQSLPLILDFLSISQLPIGRKCIQHYREMSRNPVFSHEELVCKMAADPDGLDLDLAKAVYSEMLAVVEREANRRHRLAKIVGLYYMYNSRLKNHLLYM